MWISLKSGRLQGSLSASVPSMLIWRNTVSTEVCTAWPAGAHFNEYFSNPWCPNHTLTAQVCCLRLMIFLRNQNIDIEKCCSISFIEIVAHKTIRDQWPTLKLVLLCFVCQLVMTEIYRILPDKCACLNKRAPDLYSGLRVHFLPPRLVHLFSEIWYVVAASATVFSHLWP